ncbi:MAG TPA: hypothetical protein PKG81_05350, partial [Candidatus Omnitrophota bacterium]|nr:hypothetical protein [Candidatus Omnitrophota bacterium]
VTPIEKKFDKNKNGSLNLDEIKLLLQHKNSLIHARGKAKVESVHEKKFDTNNDGMLDLQESQEIEESL